MENLLELLYIKNPSLKNNPISKHQLRLVHQRYINKVLPYYFFEVYKKNKIQLLNTSLQNWLVLKSILEQKYAIEYFEKGDLNLEHSNIENQLKITSLNLELTSEYKGENVISLFTSSVYSLTMEELKPVFDFIEYIGSTIKNEIRVYEAESKTLLFTYKNNN